MQVIKLPKASTKTGISRSAIYLKVATGEFPKPIRLGKRSIGFLEHEIDAWIEDRVAASRAGTGKARAK